MRQDRCGHNLNAANDLHAQGPGLPAGERMQPLTFVHVSDSHLVTDPHRKGMEFAPALLAAEALVREIEALPAPCEFVLHTGDVNHDPEREEDYRQSLELYSRLSVPVYFLPGNHDCNTWFQRVLRERDDPAPHADQEFEAGGVQFLLLDSSVADMYENVGHGYLASEQLAWLEQRCAAQDSRPLVVALHHNPLSLAVSWPEGPDFAQRGGAARDSVAGAASSALRPVRTHP